MRNILATIGGAVVLFLGLGWYLGWYSFILQPSSAGKQRIQVDVDTDKMKDDAKKALDTASKATENRDTPKSGDPAFMGPPTQEDANFFGPPTPVDAKKKSSGIPNSIPGPLRGPK